ALHVTKVVLRHRYDQVLAAGGASVKPSASGSSADRGLDVGVGQGGNRGSVATQRRDVEYAGVAAVVIAAVVLSEERWRVVVEALVPKCQLHRSSLISRQIPLAKRLGDVSHLAAISIGAYQIVPNSGRPRGTNRHEIK